MIKPGRARGILGMALTWGVGLAGLASSLLVGGVLLGVVPESVYGIRELVAVAVRGLAAWGFVGTAAVATALTLTLPVALPALVLLPAVLLAGAVGSGAAVGVLRLAQRADARLHPSADAVPPALPPAI